MEGDRRTDHRPRALQQGGLSLLIVEHYRVSEFDSGDRESVECGCGGTEKNKEQRNDPPLGNKVEYGSFDFSIMMRHDHPPSTLKGLPSSATDHVAETREMTCTRDNPSRAQWPL